MLDALPVWIAYLVTATLFVGLAVGSLLVPRAEVLRDAPDQARWRDIRIWSVVLIAIQLGIYAVFN